MNDAVSRKAVVDTIHRMRNICDTNDIDDYHDLLVVAVDELPTHIASDCVSRWEVLDAVNAWFQEYANRSMSKVMSIQDVLRNLPSAQPEKMQLSREDATFDCISRQTAIDALDGLCDRECEYSKKQRHTMCGACHLGSAFDVIEQLPPSRENLVNNSDHIVNYLANDTNSRQAAIDMIKRYSTWSQTYSNMVEDAISRQAAIDAVMKLRNAEVEHYGKTPCKGYWELTAAREMIKNVAIRTARTARSL